MEVLSIIKHSLASDGTNPITGHFRLIKQVSCAGQEMVWKIFDAVRIKDGKVSQSLSVLSLPILTHNKATQNTPANRCFARNADVRFSVESSVYTLNSANCISEYYHRLVLYADINCSLFEITFLLYSPYLYAL